MTAGWCSRTLRAAVFAAVCVLLAALGHVMMSGSHVPAWTLAAGVAATGVAGWCLAGRERGLPLIMTAVVATQTALHSAFSLAQSASAAPTGHGMEPLTMGPRGMGPMNMGPTHMGPLHRRSMDSMDAMDTGHMDVGHMDVGHMTHSGSSLVDSSSFGMLAAHLLAALLCGLWLAYGEKAAFRILRAVAGWLAAPLRLLLALPAPADRPRVRARRRRSDRAPRLLLVHAITSRGPPLGTSVV
ncbi:hypothetical protein AB0H86_17990 [Streptomyces sp. NPDC050997]|uniref:hypothetical protein n=1 Tax=Streptomyces sp. NPDC050997 TaxID=3155519 RepID=UPI003420179B